jgi:hypothetical protein
MMRMRMRLCEFEKPLTLQQTQDKALKQQAKRIQLKQKQLRLQKLHKQANDAASQITKLQNKSP